MAASKKSSTSKTARVMNLLSKNREEAPPVEPIAAPAPAPAPAPATAPVVEESAPNESTAVAAEPVAAPPAPAPAHAAPTPPILTTIQADSAISNQVMSALEDALASEINAAAPQSTVPVAETVPTTVSPTPAEIPAPAETPVAAEAPTAAEMPVSPAPTGPEMNAITPEPTPTQPAPAPVPAAVAPAPVVEIAPEVPVETTPVETAPVPVVEPVTQAPVETTIPVEPAPAPVAEPAVQAPAAPNAATDDAAAPPTKYKVDSTTTYVNVMEAMVEEKAMKYIEMFGLCTCPRCVADVKALALNKLSPKYVVMRTGEMIPRITLYEGQFSVAVTAQILTACSVVMANPRHDK